MELSGRRHRCLRPTLYFCKIGTCTCKIGVKEQLPLFVQMTCKYLGVGERTELCDKIDNSHLAGLGEYTILK